MRPVTVTAQNGVNDGNSVTVPLDYMASPFNIGFGCVVTSGTPTFKVQHTFDNVLDPSVTPTWFDNTSVNGKTANVDGNYVSPVRGIRVAVTAGTGVVTLTAVQALVQSSPGQSALGQPVFAKTDLLTGGIEVSAAGKVIPLNRYTPPVSQYDRALISAAPTRQANAVKGLSRNVNDAMYVGAITDAEVYDTEAGSLSVGQSTSKALAFPWRKMLWDLSAGESLLVQARIKTVGATTSSNVLFGNSDGTVEGFGLVLYGPTHATTPGRLLLNFKGTGSAGQAIVVTPARVAGASVSALVLPTDTYHNITIHVDGATKRLDVWVNGEQGLNNSAQTLNAGSTINPTPRNFGIGYIPADDGFTSSAAKAARLQVFRMAVLPSGLRFMNPGFLDRQFNANPSILFADSDYVGSI